MRKRYFSSLGKVLKYVSIRHPGTTSFGDGINWDYYRIDPKIGKLILGHAQKETDGRFSFVWNEKFEPNLRMKKSIRSLK